MSDLVQAEKVRQEKQPDSGSFHLTSSVPSETVQAGQTQSIAEACAGICEELIPKNDPSDWTEYARAKAEALTEAAKQIRIRVGGKESGK